MKITVPFIYEAMIVPNGKRKPIIVPVRDTVEVEIKEMKDFPVAFRIGETLIHWANDTLWDLSTTCVAGQEPQKVLAHDVKTITESSGEGYPYSCSGAKAPFHNFWQDHGERLLSRHDINMCAMRNWLKDDHVTTKDMIEAKEWIDDNRDSVVAAANEIASGLCINAGIMYRATSEPRYVVMTYGLGNNHSSTDLLVVMAYNQNIPNKSYFSALEYEKACEAADKVAANRGDTKSMPVRPTEKIEVFIQEAVKLNPAQEHGTGNSFLNAIEDGINHGGAAGGIAAAMAGIGSH